MFGFFSPKQKNKNAAAGAYIVFDIGGTNTRVAKASGDSVGEVLVRPTPKGPQEGIALILSLAKEVQRGESVQEIVGSIAGKIDSAGVLLGARNLRSWEGMNIVDALSSALRVPAHVLNDCELEGLGEAHYGAGKGAKTLAYITVSTGVGGARIANGKIDFAASDFVVGEIPVEGGDLENSISGTAVKKRLGIEPKDLDSLEERTRLAIILGQALVQVVRRWEPDTMVIGGSMVAGKQNTLPLGVVEAELLGAKLRGEIALMPKVHKAELGNTSGLLGALMFAKGER